MTDSSEHGRFVSEDSVRDEIFYLKGRFEGLATKRDNLNLAIGIVAILGTFVGIFITVLIGSLERDVELRVAAAVESEMKKLIAEQRLDIQGQVDDIKELTIDSIVKTERTLEKAINDIKRGDLPPQNQ